MRYVFHYFLSGSLDPVAERRALSSDAEARVRGAAELLQMPARTGVDVWQGERLVYSRRRPNRGRAGQDYGFRSCTQ